MFTYIHIYTYWIHYGPWHGSCPSLGPPQGTARHAFCQHPRWRNLRRTAGAGGRSWRATWQRLGFMGFLWDFYGFLWDFYWISMGFLWDFYGISIGFLWDFYGISMGFLLDFYGISMGFMGFLRVLVGFLWLVVRFLRFFWTDLLKFPVRSVEVNQVVIWEMVVHACPIFVLEKSWNCHGCRGFDIDSFITQF